MSGAAEASRSQSTCFLFSRRSTRNAIEWGTYAVRHHSDCHAQHRRRADVQLTLDMQQLAPFPTLNTRESERLIKRDGGVLAATAYGLW